MSQEERSPRVDYVPGDAPHELARLERQAAFFSEMTADVLLRAGLQPGMRVLDLGCGVGDVSMIASDLVGSSGRVLAIDQSRDAIAVAQRRMMAAGRHNVGFLQRAIEEIDGLEEFDAVIGRFILVHLPNAADVLAQIRARVNSGTIIAFCELDLGLTATNTPSPLLDRSVRWIMEVFARTGRKPNMGSELLGTFRAAGLSPTLTAYQRVGTREELDGLHFLADSVRTLVPAIEKLGIATSAEVDIETLADRLSAEALAADPCIFFPRFVGAWAQA